MKLKNIQQQLQQSLLQETDIAVTPVEHVAIYRNNVCESLIKTLYATYPVCLQLVGKSFFTATARQYITNYPSHSKSLDDYGDMFADFLETFEPAKQISYLSDMARLEWAWHRANIAASHVPLNLNALAELSEQQQEDIIFELSVTAHLLSSQFPIREIWACHQNDITKLEQINMKNNDDYLIIWRPELDVLIQTISQDQMRLLSAFSRGETFGKVCDRLSEEMNIAEVLPEIIQQGFLGNAASLTF